MRFSAILFDLDGALVDSIEDLAASCNKVLAARNFPVHRVEDYNFFVGDGLDVLMERIVPPGTSAEVLVACCQEFGLHYQECWHENSTPYKGIKQMINDLREAEIPLGILSNKPDAFTQKVVEFFFPEHPFTYISGQRADVPKKPNAAGALLAARTMGIEAQEMLFIGDTSVDMQTGKNSGMTSLGVSWGFRPIKELRAHRADFIVNTPQEIVELCL
ncbi:HAD family hydrolase [Desulfotalea psychrophila]|uniref:phosphoglycolate phosphatase n=1 Tax=Desulfotalea psychrophila (strain LSv54 / DSM 12343) TaxID=177439 RepID=Q6ALB2_DESPS|nr:HAD family hydrolase [Desulfotalea psychrophila]CAG36863.1 related to phosphoglycolate phosphatase [Desulfotalea psychrophila LSv54]